MISLSQKHAMQLNTSLAKSMVVSNAALLSSHAIWNIYFFHYCKNAYIWENGEV